MLATAARRPAKEAAGRPHLAQKRTRQLSKRFKSQGAAPPHSHYRPCKNVVLMMIVQTSKYDEVLCIWNDSDAWIHWQYIMLFWICCRLFFQQYLERNLNCLPCFQPCLESHYRECSIPASALLERDQGKKYALCKEHPKLMPSQQGSEAQHHGVPALALVVPTLGVGYFCHAVNVLWGAEQGQLGN